MDKKYDRYHCGERLRGLREEKRYSQSALQELSGVDSKTISRIERGVTKTSIDTLCMLAIALNTSLDYLAFGVEGPTMEKFLSAMPEGKRRQLMKVFKLILEVVIKNTS